MRETTDTRTRIQEIALKLFTEQGYEATSLREIAEALGVTKAALYYHFKTKDDIIASLTEERQAMVERLVKWTQDQTPTVEARREFVRRYADELFGGHHQAFMRFMERNQTALRDHPKLGKMRDLMVAMVGFLSDEEDPPARRLRSSMALFALHAAMFVLSGDELTDEERKSAALQVAMELIEPRED
ncbi:TetR family transcriptional regulator [Sphaerisporangium rubeum]|uniref:AcrR family transcriptional regulator n=1 Tax=Sphaerisporangium rubeum TaxID=321317 RepID=A0A7X0IF17_9ACTN|nr:TetR/AcrR family transcriptional regulator [Sphaerisporangium rubeum]MBB6474026.1 AcrR family transcriptional regulator [Sphaerisporangium rubeum]